MNFYQPAHYSNQPPHVFALTDEGFYARCRCGCEQDGYLMPWGRMVLYPIVLSKFHGGMWN